MKVENGKIVSNDPSMLHDQMEVARFQRWLGESANGRRFRGETAAYLGMTEAEHADACAAEERKQEQPK